MTSISSDVHTAPDRADTGDDALRMVGTLALLVRTLDGSLRHGADDGLSLSDISILGRVQRGLSMPSALARGMRLDPGRMTRLIDRLVALGYLEREIDSADRRRCILTLTPAGQRRLAEGKRTVRAAMADLLSGLTPGERAGLSEGLAAVRLLLDAGGEGR